MSRYYFDLQNGDGKTDDEHGQEVSSSADFRKIAAQILVDIARDEVPFNVDGKAVVTVRSEEGKSIYRAQMIFHGEDL